MADIIVRKPRSKQETDRMAEMYVSEVDQSFLPVSMERSKSFVLNVSRTNSFVRVATVNDRIVGFIIAVRVRSPHMDVDMLQQVYYYSDQKGVLAVKLVRVLHDALIEFARAENIRYVLSQGSHEDETFVFARILEKSGWKRKGFLAVYEIH